MRRPDVSGFVQQPPLVLSLDSDKIAWIKRCRATGKLILPVGTTKGGAGKSTLTLNLAVAFGMRARRVLAIDCDTEQKTSANWPRSPELDNPRVISCEPRHLIDLLADHVDDFDVVLIDMPGRDERGMSAILSVSDILIAPLSPSPMDLPELGNYARIADALGVPHIAIFNQATREWTAELDLLAQRYAEHGPFLPVAIRHLQTYRRVYSVGRGVAEISGAEMAKANFGRVFDALLPVIQAAHNQWISNDKA